MMTLGRELRDLGHSVRFLGFSGRGLADDVRKEGFEAFTVRVRSKIDPFAIVRIARHVRDSGSDIVHTHLSTSSINGCLAARLARRPAVATVHGLSGKLSFAWADHLIAVSNVVRNHLIDQGVRPEKVSVVHNGIRPIDGRPWVEARHELGLAEGEFAIGTVARLTPLKGIHHAIHAMPRVLADRPNAILLVFGDGDERATYEALCRSLGIESRVRFFGYRADVRSLLPGLDAFVFPSLREAMGIAVVEAMMAGLPVAATDVGGLPEVVRPGAGLLFSPGNPHEIADALLKLIAEPRHRQTLAATGQALAESEFTARQMALRTLGVYATVRPVA